MAAEKNRARFLSVNFMRLTREVLVAFPLSGFDLRRMIARLRNSIWGYDLTLEQKRALLFSAKGWDDLPMAVLEARYLSLPPDRLPDTRESLAALCRWLMSRDDDETLIETCVRGWADADTPFMALNRFVDGLWVVRRDDPAFFAAVVHGQHAIALEMIAARRLSPALHDDLAVNILTHMALIWAAFDCQATAARARRSMTRPMGWLIIGDAERMRASTLVSVFRPISDAMRRFVGSYRTSENRIGTKKPKSRLSAVADIRASATAYAKHLDAKQGSFVLDTVLTDIASRIIQSGDPFFHQVSREKTDSAFGDQQMSQCWYPDLRPLQIVGMAAMRLAQMEQQLQPLLHDTVTSARVTGAKPQLMVPDFHDIPLRPGWKGRSRGLADALRGAVLGDADHQSVRRSRARAKGGADVLEGSAHDDQFVDAVQLFLAQAGRYGPARDRASWAERRRAFEDLDVAVGKRFTTVSHF